MMIDLCNNLYLTRIVFVLYCVSTRVVTVFVVGFSLLLCKHSSGYCLIQVTVCVILGKALDRFFIFVPPFISSWQRLPIFCAPAAILALSRKKVCIANFSVYIFLIQPDDKTSPAISSAGPKTPPLADFNSGSSRARFFSGAVSFK